MKKTLRIISLMLVIFTVVSLAVVAFPAAAEEGEGLTFEATSLYAPDKAPEEAVNTFEAWVNIPRNTKNKTSVLLSNKWTGNRQITISITSGYPVVALAEAENVSGSWSFKTANAICTGRWEHIAIVRDPEALTLSCYLNGELKGTADLGALWNNDIIPGEPLCIGGMWSSGNPDYCKGAIREIATFSTARTAEQIAADMVSPLGAEGLVTYYDMTNAKVGENIRDLSGNGYHARYRENATWLTPDEVESPTDYAYSFAVVGDMQALNYYYPDDVDTMFKWIADNAEAKKIEYVFGLGDITEKSSAEEWERAKKGIHLMDGKVDYSIVRGNHDNSANFITYFPWSDYSDSHDGSLSNNMLNTYRLFEVGEVKYLFINLDFGFSDSVITWASALCKKYSDRNVIINTHAYLYINGRPLTQNDHTPPKSNHGANNGDDMWEKFISKHENISLVLCGHSAGDRLLVTREMGENDNMVTSLLVNTSNVEKNNSGALGMIALLYFSEDGREVDVEYYSTVTDRYFRSVNLLSFELDMAGEPYVAPEEMPLPELETEPEETTAPTEETTEAPATEAATSAPETTEAPVTEAPATEAPTTEAPKTEAPTTEAPEEEEKGCGSTVGVAGIALITALGTCTVFVAKKRD